MKKLFALFMILCLVPGMAVASVSLYTPGIYTVETVGFGGKILVEAEVSDNTILRVSVLENEETEGIGSRAIELLPDEFIHANSADVDEVAGATVTSSALKEAVYAILNQAKGVSAQPSVMKDGVYTVTTDSFSFIVMDDKSTLTLDVTIKDNAITNIMPRDYGDTEAIGGIAFDLLSKRVIEAQSLAVDSVTGATVSSAAFKTAVSEALAQAGADVMAWKSATIEKPAATSAVYEAQVVVIGAGMAGLCATLEALEQGLDVILVEKQDILGGSTTRSEGFVMAAGTDVQKTLGIEDTQDEFWDAIFGLYKDDSMLDETLLRQAVYSSTDLIQFLTDAGTPFTGVTRVDDDYPRDTPRCHTVAGKGGGITSALYTRIVEKGGRVMMGTPCTELIMDGNAVRGIKCTNAFGDDITIKANATILCAGSYAGNKELFEELHPDIHVEALFGYGNGDSYTLAKSANADMINLDYPQLMYYTYSPNYTSTPSVRPGSPTAPVYEIIMLDGGGNRVVNEDAFCFEFVAENWKSKYLDGWALVGDAFAQRYPDVIDLALKSTMASRNLPMGYTADSLEALCEIAGLDYATVKASLERYNQLCDLGQDLDFGKASEYMEPIEGSYYLLRMPQVVTDGYSGCRINIDAQVVDVNGDVIPGFYAAGGSAVAQMSCVNYFGCGTSLLLCGVYGRAAARHIAQTLNG